MGVPALGPWVASGCGLASFLQTRVSTCSPEGWEVVCFPACCPGVPRPWPGNGSEQLTSPLCCPQDGGSLDQVLKEAKRIPEEILGKVSIAVSV